MPITPPLNTKGRFVLKSPFKADPTKLYSVIGLRTLLELVGNAGNPFINYYQPNGLTQSDFDKDYSAGATIVILYSQDGAMLFVPDTYIQSFPTQSIPDYGNYVLSALLGPFRTDFDFSLLSDKVADTISDVLGVKPTTYVDSVGEAQPMSVNDAETLEANRQAAIKDRDTSYAKLLQAQGTITDLQAQIKSLQDAYTALANKK